jgi:hypothetical protein
MANSVVVGDHSPRSNLRAARSHCQERFWRRGVQCKRKWWCARSKVPDCTFCRAHLIQGFVCLKCPTVIALPSNTAATLLPLGVTLTVPFTSTSTTRPTWLPTVHHERHLQGGSRTSSVPGIRTYAVTTGSSMHHLTPRAAWNTDHYARVLGKPGRCVLRKPHPLAAVWPAVKLPLGTHCTHCTSVGTAQLAGEC